MKGQSVAKSQANIGNILEQQSLQSHSELDHKEKQLNVNSGDGDGDEDYIDRKTQSRATSKQYDPEKIWTEEEILADEDLWRVTDSSEDSSEEEQKIKEAEVGSPTKSGFGESANNASRMAGSRMAGSKLGQSNNKSPPKKTPYNPYERNQDYYENEEALKDEQEQMARYLIDKAPKADNFDWHERFTDMQRKTKTERKAILTREFILKCQCELAMQRSIRPDLMQQALHKIVGTVFDFNYLSFELDVLAKFIDPDGTLAWRRHKMSTGLQTGRIDGSKNNA